MTALCGGGASSALPGAQAVTLLASGFLAVALDLYGAPWLKWALPFLGLPELTLVSFCASDPPAIPTFTAAESKALVNLTFGADFNSGLSKFSDLVQHLAWYQLCQCTSGTLTALPAAPAPPAGTPVWTPPPPQGAARCASTHFVQGIDNTVYPGGVEDAWVGAVPAAITSCRVTCFIAANIAPGVAVTTSVKFFRGTTVLFTTPSFTQNPGDPRRIVDFAVPVGADDVHAVFVPNNAAGSSSIDCTVDLYCNGQLPGGTVGPCGPDAATQLALEEILRMVTLLQRQLVPFAYISSTAHAGLTGQGTIAVQGLLGLRIDLTTMPASLTQDLSTPPFVYNVGWVSMEDANGFIDETRAHAQHQVWFSRIASDATLIGYSFAPGVVATITELQREP